MKKIVYLIHVAISIGFRFYFVKTVVPILRIHAEMILRIAIALKISSDSLLGINNDYKEKASSLRFMKSINQIEKLPLSKQKALLTTIDAFLKGESKD